MLTAACRSLTLIVEVSVLRDLGHTLKLALFIALSLMSATFIFWWVRSVCNERTDKQPPDESEMSRPSAPTRLAIGFGTNFLDTLGIGSFATTTAAFKLLRIVRDEYIPGTMIVGHTLPVVTQAFNFMTAVRMDPVILVLLILASLIGGWLGAGIVSALPRRLIQVGMGVALLLAAFAVKSLSLDAIRWLVMGVIVYTAVTMLRSANAERVRGGFTFTAEEKLP